MAHLLISAAHKSSGKTTVTTGICAALNQRGRRVQPFKKGPDYIDPMWLAQASGRACFNLDFHTMAKGEIQALFQQHSADADIAIVEGNKGLFDGVDLDGSNSNASLAKLLKSPVVLVIDARGMTRGIAPLLLGYQAFDPETRIAGVIINKLGGVRHERKLRDIVEHYTDIPLLGAVHQDNALEISERHLGLIPSNESRQARTQIQRLADAMAAQVDLDALTQIAASAPGHNNARLLRSRPNIGRRLRIGIARDAAFGFYYASDLEALENAGAELVFVDTLHDKQLPAVDGLFIGGGFPETQAAALEKNRSLREQIRHAIEGGLPTYAECGGMMYLSRSIHWQGRRHAMVGVIEADAVMHERPQGRGYMVLKETGRGLWPGLDGEREIRRQAHEFHYSGLENLAQHYDFAYEVQRGHGITGKHDGLVYKNMMANYAHLRDVNAHHWAERFVSFVAEVKYRNQSLTQTATAS